MRDPNPPGPDLLPGWYPDDAGGQRWWDGLEWGEQVAAEPVRGRRRLVASVGGGVLLVAVAAVVVLVVARDDSGGTPDPDSPEAVALAYLDAQYRSDWSAICELSTEAEATGMRYALSDTMAAAADCAELTDASYSLRGDGVDVESTAGAVTEDGDEASVEYVQTASYDGPEETLGYAIEQAYGSDGVATGRVTLVREAGLWKVDNSTLDPEVDE